MDKPDFFGFLMVLSQAVSSVSSMECIPLDRCFIQADYRLDCRYNKHYSILCHSTHFNELLLLSVNYSKHKPLSISSNLEDGSL